MTRYGLVNNIGMILQNLIQGVRIVYSQGIRLPGVMHSRLGGECPSFLIIDLRCFLIRIRTVHFKRWALNSQPCANTSSQNGQIFFSSTPQFCGLLCVASTFTSSSSACSGELFAVELPILDHARKRTLSSSI